MNILHYPKTDNWRVLFPISLFISQWSAGTTDQCLDPEAKNLALKSSELHSLFFLSREPPGWTSVSGLRYSKILFYETSGPDLWADSKQRWDQAFVRSTQLLTLWVYKQPVKAPRVLLQTWPVVLGRKKKNKKTPTTLMEVGPLLTWRNLNQAIFFLTEGQKSPSPFSFFFFKLKKLLVHYKFSPSVVLVSHDYWEINCKKLVQQYTHIPCAERGL